MFGWYSEYAKAQGRDTYAQKGLIFYELDQAEIPIYIFFIPFTLQQEKTGEPDFQRIFDDKNTKAYILYFQAVRWIRPDIAGVMKELRYIPLQYGEIQRPMRLTYANLLFDKTFRSIAADNIKTIVVPIKLKNKVYALTVLTEWPGEFGTLKDISPIDLIFDR